VPATAPVRAAVLAALPDALAGVALLGLRLGGAQAGLAPDGPAVQAAAAGEAAAAPAQRPAPGVPRRALARPGGLL